MTFPYKIGIDRCIGSCNTENNPYFKTCLPDIIKNITVKSLNVLTEEFVFENIVFHKTCKRDYLLDVIIYKNSIKIIVDANV